MLETEVMIGVVVGGRAQEISEAFVTDRSGEDEFEAAGVRLNRGPAAGGDVGPADGTRPWADGEDPQARNRFPPPGSQVVIADRDRMADEETANVGLDACCRSSAARGLERGAQLLTPDSGVLAVRPQMGSAG